MLGIIESMAAESGFSGFLSPLLVVALKSAIILLLALAAGLLLQRGPASLRHLCWTIALGAILALPVLTLLLPSWKLAVLPAQVETTETRSATLVPQPKAPVTPIAPKAATDGVAAADEAPATIAEGGPVVTKAGSVSDPVVRMILWIWLLGTGFFLLYMAVGSIATARTAARSRQVHDARWIDVLDEIVDRLEIKRPVQFLMSSTIRVPMVWGVLRPVVMLPESAEIWDDERRRCVLTHELAHVRRWDGLTQTLAGIACAIHWMNPLVWIASHKMRLDRELACDDYVLRAARTRASSYAGHLLEIARNAPRAVVIPSAAVAMARRSQLEGRVLSILEEGANRSPSRFATAAVLVGTVLVVVPLAAFRPIHRPVLNDLQFTPTISAEAGEASVATDLVVDKALKPEKQKLAETSRKSVLVTTTNSEVNSDNLEQVFSVSPNGKLIIDSDYGSIEVRGSDQNQNQIHLIAHRRTRGNASPDDFTVSSEQSGNVVQIEGRVQIKNDRADGVEIHYEVVVPRRFNLYLETGGGSMSVENLDGMATIDTGGGNIRFAGIRGKILAETSGGGIQLTGIDGEASVSTSGGPIEVRRIIGSLEAETSGGGIDVDEAEGDLYVESAGGSIRLGQIRGEAYAETSGGGIDIESIVGQIEAETSGGSITARLTGPLSGDSRLETSGGGVTVYLADGMALDIEANTDAGKIDSEFQINAQTIRDDYLKGSLNGGGPLLLIEGSTVQIRRL